MSSSVQKYSVMSKFAIILFISSSNKFSPCYFRYRHCYCYLKLNFLAKAVCYKNLVIQVLKSSPKKMLKSVLTVFKFLVINSTICIEIEFSFKVIEPITIKMPKLKIIKLSLIMMS